MQFYLLIENNEYVIMKVKPSDVTVFMATYGSRLLLQAGSLFELLDLFETEIIHDSRLHLN